MSTLSLEKLLSECKNRYELVVLASRRAREIVDGAEPLGEVRMQNPIDIALAELAAAKLNGHHGKREIAAEPQEVHPEEESSPSPGGSCAGGPKAENRVTSKEVLDLYSR